MQLTIKQEEGLRIAVDRYRAGQKYTVISGFAGAGKSTLIRFIVQALDIPEEQIAYIAFTGKAANVLTQKGCVNATTAHKLLYYAKPMPDGKYIFQPKKSIDAKIVIVDEVSMLPKSMWELLLTHPVYILACGDPGQLPPINPEDDNHILDHPHIFLDEIMRQAQESEIIRLSMHIREGGSLNTFEAAGSQVKIISSSQLVEGMYEWADQILCATNDKRNEINCIVRNLKGFGSEPCKGDKIISLRNHWDDFSDMENPLTNGTIGYLDTFVKQDLWVPSYIYSSSKVPVILANIATENHDKFHNIAIDYNSLTIGKKLLTPSQEFQMNKNKRCSNAPYEFVYGYGITTWKAQGSEWNKILGFEENFPWDKIVHQKFLYTMTTRAVDKLVIVKKD